LADGSGINLKKTDYVYFSRTRPPEVPLGGLEFEGEQIKRVEDTRVLGVWVDAGLNWRGHIGQVGAKVRQLLGVLGRIGADFDEHLLLSLYNSMVLPHLQYCLMVWGNFEAGRNGACEETLLKLQKRFVGLIAGKRGCYHADPLFARSLRWGTYIGSSSGFTRGSSGTVGSRMDRWRLRRVDESHGYGTRSAWSGLVLGSARP
jgi:hypothetical protein